MAKEIDFKKITLRKEIGSRGGGMEIDLGKIDKKYDGEKMSAYQNYLGGGMGGRVANSCTISNWESDTVLYEVGLALRKYYFTMTTSGTDEEFKVNQTLPVSAY